MQERAARTLEGLVLGQKYELVKRIGAGGMGEVYRGRQLSTGGRVAVKVMSTLNRAEKTIDRFRYEAETTAQLTHPNTVRILDFGSDKDVFYLVMEYLSGTDLTRFLRPGGQSEAFVSHVLFQVAGSLTEAHSRGVVHRDIKPNNIMLLHHVGHPSFAKVIDFGIARAIGGPGLGTMGILGTIGYIAPEQAAGEVMPDARTDLYALGCVAYELFTGRLPFDGITHQSAPLDILEAHRVGRPTHVRSIRPDADSELSDLIMRMLSRDPDERPRSAGDLVVPLHSIRSRASAGIAYGLDVPEPTQNPEVAFEHENVMHAHVLTDQHLVGQTIADDAGVVSPFSATVASPGHDHSKVALRPTHEDTSAAPAAGSIPPPLHQHVQTVPPPDIESRSGFGSEPSHSGDFGLNPPRADQGTGWSFGDDEVRTPAETAGPHRRSGMFHLIILGTVILGGMLWFALRG